MNLALYADPIDRLHQANLKSMKELKYISYPNNMPFANQVEIEVARQIKARGYNTHFTAHSDSYQIQTIF